MRAYFPEKISNISFCLILQSNRFPISLIVCVSQSEFNEDESDPYHSQQTEDKNQPEPMQLPDDLDLDGEGQGESEGEEEEQTEGKKYSAEGNVS